GGRPPSGEPSRRRGCSRCVLGDVADLVSAPAEAWRPAPWAGGQVAPGVVGASKAPGGRRRCSALHAAQRAAYSLAPDQTGQVDLRIEGLCERIEGQLDYATGAVGALDHQRLAVWRPQHNPARRAAPPRPRALGGAWGGLGPRRGRGRGGGGGGGGGGPGRRVGGRRGERRAQEGPAGDDQRPAQADKVLQRLHLSLAEGSTVELIDDQAAEATEVGGTVREVLRRAEPYERRVELAKRPQGRADLLLRLREVADEAESCARPGGPGRLRPCHDPP